MAKDRAGQLKAVLSILAALLALSFVASAQGDRVGAETGAVAWDPPEAIVSQLDHAARPALVYGRDGAAHAVWESDGVLYYAAAAPGHPWDSPRRVAVGNTPSLVIDPAGALHLVFSNLFMGNQEIYYVTQPAGGQWSLPINVSHTSGDSQQPVLAQSTDGALHVVWMDRTPGYWMIYHGAWSGRFWSSEPVPSARGRAPALAAAPNGSLYVAWQDNTDYGAGQVGAYQVYLSQLTGSEWTLPINVSDHPGVNCIGVSVAATTDGLAHVAWTEEGQQLAYSYGAGVFWSVPQPVFPGGNAVRGPRLAVERGTTVHLAWDEGVAVLASSLVSGSGAWSAPVIVAQPEANLRDVTLSSVNGGGITVGWVQAAGPGDVGVYESKRHAVQTWRYWVPTVLH